MLQRFSVEARPLERGLLWLDIFPQSCQRDKAGGEKRMQRSGKAITHFGELEAWDGKLLS